MLQSSDNTILATHVLKDASAYRSRFVSSAPFPHVVIENFLEPTIAAALLADFPSFERGNAIGDDGNPGGKSTMDQVRQLGPAYRQLDDAIKSPAFLRAIGELTGIDDLLYDPWYLGGGTHENRNGMSLDPHVDFNYHPSERWHRRLNLIVYLNHDWKHEWGGCLELFRDPQTESTPTASVAPTFNRCVIFETSEHSWHAFNRITLPAEKGDETRRSIALYFYTRDRPADEIAPRHTTYYVKRHLPAHLAEGHHLTQQDMAEVKQLLDERDAQIRLLYAENTDLRKAQDAGFSGHLLYLAKRAYVRLRRK